MLFEVIIWVAVAPLVAATGVLLVAKPWRKTSRQSSLWSGPVAIGAAFSIAHLKLIGSPGMSIEGGLLSVALLGVAWGIVESFVGVTNKVRIVASIGISAVSSLLIITPLAEPQGWSTLQLLLRLVIHTTVTVAVWQALFHHLKSARGPSSPLALSAFAAGSSLVVVLGGLATAGQLQGSLAVVLFVVAIFVWRSNNRVLLGAASAPLALIFVAHWTAAVVYGELPLLSSGFLVIGPLALLALQLRPFQRLGPLAVLALSLALVAIPLGGASVPAAMHYFGLHDTQTLSKAGPPRQVSSESDKSTKDNDGEDDDYGY